MGILATLERRSLENPAVPLSRAAFLADLIGEPTEAGVRMTPEKALTISAVWRAVSVIANSVATTPLILYERLERGKRRATEQRLYRILHDQPNPEITAFTFKQTLQAHVLLWGNAYAEIEYDGAGRVVALWPLLPHETRVERRDGEKVYITHVDGRPVVLPAWRVFHVPGLGYDGLMGYSVVRMARESLGHTAAVERFGASWFGRGSRPSGVLTYEGTLTREQRERLREEWQAVYGGLSNAHRVAILEASLKWQQIGLPPEDAQFLQTREFQVREVARWFGVPPHKIGDLRDAHHSNIEQQSIDYLTDSLLPWFVAWEQAVNATLLSVQQQGRYFAEFLQEVVLRGDSAARGAFYQRLWQIGALSINEIRERENLNPVDGGDVYLVPVNMMPLEAALRMAAEPPDAPGPPEPPVGQSVQDGRAVLARSRLRRQYERLLEDAAGRALAREVNAARRAVGRGREELARWLSGEFGDEQREFWRRVTAASVTAYAEAVRDLILDELGRTEDEPPDVSRAVEQYLRGLAAREVAASSEAYAAALQDGGSDAVARMLDAWERGRPAEVARREARRIIGAISLEVYRALGVPSVRWVAVDDSAACQALHGRAVPIGEPFTDGVRHPPAGDGCDCILLPAWR